MCFNFPSASKLDRLYTAKGSSERNESVIMYYCQGGMQMKKLNYVCTQSDCVWFDCDAPFQQKQAALFACSKIFTVLVAKSCNTTKQETKVM